MRRITIVGAGQAGLQLALGLLEYGYAVTLVSERTASDIQRGYLQSAQCLFGTAVDTERDLNLNFWTHEAPSIQRMAFRLSDPSTNTEVGWYARLAYPAQAVDQRLKFAAWMRLFEARGGDLRFARVGVPELEMYARESELVVVAVGRGNLARLFVRDPRRSPFDKPQRTVALCAVVNRTPVNAAPTMTFAILPGVGEFRATPGLTEGGLCEFLVFEAVPGGPLDCWDAMQTPVEHLALTQTLLTRWLPWLAERYAAVELTDHRAVYRGRLTPVVRHPIGNLPSGAFVLGLGDSLILNDPLTAQGANQAARGAAVYLERILEREDAAFDQAWMQGTFEQWWQAAEWATRWTNTMLQPPTPHLAQLLRAAAILPGIAQGFADGFDDPAGLFPWLIDPYDASEFLATHLLSPAQTSHPGGMILAGT